MSKPKNIAAEIINGCAYTRYQIADMLGMSRSYPYQLASGEKDFSKIAPHWKLSFLNLALTIPETRRSAELDKWIADTQSHFEAHPLGGVFL